MEETKSSILSDALYFSKTQQASSTLEVTCDLYSLRDASSKDLTYPSILSLAPLQSSQSEILLGTAQMSSAPWKGGHAVLNIEEAFGEVNWSAQGRKSGPIEVKSAGFGNSSIVQLKSGIKSWVEYSNSVTAVTQSEKDVIVGTQDGTIYVYDRVQDRGSVLNKKRAKNVDQIFADIMYEHGDAITSFAKRENILLSTSLDGKLNFWKLSQSAMTVLYREVESKIHDGYPLISSSFLTQGAIVSGGMSKKLVLHDNDTESLLLSSKHGTIRKLASQGRQLAVGYDYGCVEIYDDRKISQGQTINSVILEKGQSMVFDLKASEQGFIIGHQKGIDMINDQSGYSLIESINAVRAVQPVANKQILFSCDGFGVLGRASWRSLQQGGE